MSNVSEWLKGLKLKNKSIFQNSLKFRSGPKLEKCLKFCNGPKFKNGLKLNLVLMFKHGPNIGRGLMTLSINALKFIRGPMAQSLNLHHG